MMEPEKIKSDEFQADSMESDVGDVETAGETTAAAAINGPVDTRPVGADTMVKVSDTREHTDSDDDND